MGRIVVFTSQDINSQQLIKALQKRKLPFDEVSLKDRPSRASDLESLIDGPAIVPHMFVHTRHVGGLDRALKELKRWDGSARFDTPLAKFEAEVLPLEEPQGEDRLAPNSAGYKVVDPPPAPIQPHTVVKLVTGKTVPLRETTELMKEALPKMDMHKYKGVTHRNCFSGKELMSSLKKHVNEGEEKCLRFLKRLLEAKVLHHVDHRHDEEEFHPTDKEFYRLQCYEAPEILNTYRLWPSGRRPCVSVVEDLAKRLTTVEMASLDAEGLFDYQQARQNPEYTIFEDAVCELQNFSKEDLTALDKPNATAMALNIYNIMQRYSFIKIGVPISHADRQHYSTHVKFNVCGDIFTLKEWVEIIRGHGAGKFKYLNQNIQSDYRNLFALNMGAHSGSTWSTPFNRFTASLLDQQLDQAAAAFCSEERNVNVRRKEGKVEMVSLFKQYHGDFCRDDKGLLAIIRKFAIGKTETELGKILDDKESFKISYHDPELGFHVSNGPWYNSKDLGLMHSNKKTRQRRNSAGATKNLKDPLGGSEHSSASSHSNYSWR